MESSAFGAAFVSTLRGVMKLRVSYVIIIFSLCLSGFIRLDWALAGCSDTKYLEAEKIYKQALEAEAPSDKIRLFERAFSTCPSHGNHAQGYYSLGKLYFDQNEKTKAFEWLKEANRFAGALIQMSVEDLAQTNYLLGNLYRERGDSEKALIHLNIYRQLAGRRDKSFERDFIRNADAILAVIYSPDTIKETLAVDKSIAREHRSQLNRVEVYFDFAKASLDADAKKRLDSIGAALQSAGFRDCTLVVEGHTDEVGSEASNCQLGARRAKSACDYLKRKWLLNDVNFVPVSYGKFNCTVHREGHAAQEWPKIDRLNRRVAVWNSGVTEVGEKDMTVEFMAPASPCRK
jgi:outer membrane protein OmpA-like peptidoglycan-associated protein